MKNIFELSLEDWEEFFISHNEKPYRAKQVLEWIYQKKAVSFDSMTSLSLNIRKELEKNFTFEVLKTLNTLESKLEPGTLKILFQTHDHHLIESVLMPNLKNSHTICISTQAGCVFACDFCATGKMGFKRNLTLSEILYQVWAGLLKSSISNIVFMGMGEPLLNPDVFEALKRLSNEKYFGLSSRGITVSTIGIPDGIIKMADLKQIKLAWSYHSSFEEKRKKIFPVLSEKISLLDIKKAFRKYQDLTKKRITIEFLILKGFNDTIEEAEALKKLSKEIYFHLNLIPYNPHPLSEYERPSQKDITRFLNLLKDSNFEISVRDSKGRDIQGACGQLAGK